MYLYLWHNQNQEGGTYDVIFTLENCQNRFYFNRGLEKGMNLNDLKEKLIGLEVVLNTQNIGLH